MLGLLLLAVTMAYRGQRVKGLCAWEERSPVLQGCVGAAGPLSFLSRGWG